MQEFCFKRTVDWVWNVIAHAQKPDFVFLQNGRVHLNRQGRQFSRLLAAEVCASVVVMVVMLDKPCSEVAWRVLATHSIRQFPLHFPSRASPCAIKFQLDSNTQRNARTVKSWCNNAISTSITGVHFICKGGKPLVFRLLLLRKVKRFTTKYYFISIGKVSSVKGWWPLTSHIQYTRK